MAAETWWESVLSGKYSIYTSFDRKIDADFEHRTFLVFLKFGEFVLNYKIFKSQFRLEDKVLSF